jgi:hypothetical protein
VLAKKQFVGARWLANSWGEPMVENFKLNAEEGEKIHGFTVSERGIGSGVWSAHCGAVRQLRWRLQLPSGV